MLPYDELSGIDISDIKFGPEKLRQQVSFGGKYYGAFYYLWESPPNINGLILIYDDLFYATAGEIHPREQVENGEWTWENFRTLLANLTYTDGSTKKYGLGIENEIPSGTTSLAYAAILSNGGDIVKYLNGKYVSGLYDSETIEGVKYAQTLFSDGVCQLATSSFEYGEYPLFLSEGFPLVKADAKVQVYSSVLFPLGPSAKEDSVGAFHSDTSFVGICIGSIFDESEMSIIVNRLFDGFEDSPYDDGWKSFYADNAFFNLDDLNSYIYAIENASFFNMGMLKDTGSDFGILFTEVEQSFYDILKGTSPQTAFDSISDAFEAAVDSYYEQ